MNIKTSIQNNDALANSPSGFGGIAIVMDIGGTKIKLGLVAGDKIICTASIEAESSIGLKEKLPVIESTINDMLDQHAINKNEIKGVGISMPGIVDSVQKKVLSIDNKFNDVVGMNLSGWITNTWQTNLEI
ncbi:MAG: ROK family protein, partial [Parafilimonas sp.]|nr:ROK family protein [Parafilimonas sp.]